VYAPAGPWRIAALKAEIDNDGHISVRGRGLLLAAGNSIGQNANQRVFATLICEPSGSFIEHSSNGAGVPLDLNGDFRIDDTLSSTPSECASPVLLIRASSNGTWFAAGIRESGDDDWNPASVGGRAAAAARRLHSWTPGLNHREGRSR
jgi:hypothetical protein